MISPDRRVQAVNLFLLVGVLGHLVDFAQYDRPWGMIDARWVTPGWHQLLPTWFPLAVAGLLFVMVLVVAVRRTRGAVLALTAVYAVAHLSWPGLVRNHMGFLAAMLGTQAAVWLVAGLPRDLRRRRVVDAALADGLGVILVITYFFAGFHKLNHAFLSSDPKVSAGAKVLGQLVAVFGVSHPPPWLLTVGPVVTVVAELVLPLIAWRVPRARVVAVLALLAFHFPMISVLGVSDYPFLVSSFFPVWFSPLAWGRIWRRLRSPTWRELVGALVSVLGVVGLARLDSWTHLFGLPVAALWGLAAVAIWRAR